MIGAAAGAFALTSNWSIVREQINWLSQKKTRRRRSFPEKIFLPLEMPLVPVIHAELLDELSTNCSSK